MKRWRKPTKYRTENSKQFTWKEALTGGSFTTLVYLQSVKRPYSGPPFLNLVTQTHQTQSEQNEMPWRTIKWGKCTLQDFCPKNIKIDCLTKYVEKTRFYWHLSDLTWLLGTNQSSLFIFVWQKLNSFFTPYKIIVVISLNKILLSLTFCNKTVLINIRTDIVKFNSYANASLMILTIWPIWRLFIPKAECTHRWQLPTQRPASNGRPAPPRVAESPGWCPCEISSLCRGGCSRPRDLFKPLKG